MLLAIMRGIGVIARNRELVDAIANGTAKLIEEK